VRSSAMLVTIAIAIAMTMAAGATSAAAAAQFGSEGEGAGQLDNAAGVAVNQATGDVYVADTDNQRVAEFDAGGRFVRAWGWGVADGAEEPQACTSSCRAGLEGTGAGQFAYPNGIAVDNEPASPAEGDIYVIDPRNNRIEKFSSEGQFILMFGGEVNATTGGDVCLAGETCQVGSEGTGAGEFQKIGSEGAITVGLGGTVYVGSEGAGGEGRVQRFSSEGVYESEFVVKSAPAVRALAVDSTGDVYLTIDNSEGSLSPEVLEYEPDGTLIRTLVPSAMATHIVLATDAQGHLFVDDLYENFEEHIQQVLEYGESGEELVSIPPSGGEAEGIDGLAPIESSGEVALLGRDTVRTAPVPPPGSVVLGESAEAQPGGAATLKASVNPEGGETTCGFDYGLSVAEETSTPGVAIAAAFAAEPLEIQLTELKPDTTYHYHVRCEDSEHHLSEGADQTVQALPAVAVDSLSISHVTASGATLEAEIDPLGTASSYHFEYTTGADTVATAQATVGAGTSEVAVSDHIQGLVAGAPYSYRVIAENALGKAETTGQFTTEPAAAPLALLDGRAWEQVSPPAAEAGAAAFRAVSPGGGLSEASASGGAFTYPSVGATEPEPAGEPDGEFAQIVSNHGVYGWESQDIATRHEHDYGRRVGASAEYAIFSPNLAVALVEPPGKTPLSSAASERTPYLRVQENCDGDAKATECYLPLVTSKQGHEDVPPGTVFGAGEVGSIQIAGATPDLSDVILFSDVPLTENGPTAGMTGLYEWTAGHLQLVSVLPAAEGGAAVAGRLGSSNTPGDARLAVSNDGSSVIWSREEHSLYMRTTSPSGKTVRVDAVQSGATGSGEPTPEFQIASTNGSKVFFTDTQSLTKNSTTADQEPNVYEYDAASDSVVDLTVPVAAGEHADAQGVVLGVSQEGSIVYLVARGVLTRTPSASGATPTVGEDNLYMLHESGGSWTPTFIATLSREDGMGFNSFQGALSGDLRHLSAQVSEAGQWLAFMSDRPLTGYDSRDAVGGELDEEVFLYDAAFNRLVCASCDPNGARPVGALLPTGEGLQQQPLFDQVGNWEGHRLAAEIPGWTPYSTGPSGLYQPHYLSETGRLFFNSFDALVPQDTNHTADVYEYESPRQGGCTEASVTYGARSEGCVDLISSGISPQESAFLDASKSGNDVFFLANANLGTQETGNAYDAYAVYDAHVCGSGWECPAQQAGASSPCESASACKTPLESAAGLAGPPASLTFSGAGNLPSPASTPPVVGRVKVLGHSVHGTTITLKVAAPAKGSIVAYGAGLRTTKHRAGGAMTYTLKVRLSARARASVKRLRGHKLRHKRKVTVRVRFVPTSGKTSQTSVLAMVKA